jgi:oxygen-independent coproporphyrinogen-3 oxidase
MKINTIKYQKIFNSSVTEDFKEIWIALEKESWIKIKENEIILVEEGEFYVPLIQSLISKSQVDIISKKQAEEKESV